MKKVFPHKTQSARTPDHYHSQSSLTNTLKALVSSELKLDKKTNDDVGISLEQTNSTRKPSINSRLPKGLNHSSNNNSLVPQEESIKQTKVTAKDLSKDGRLTHRLKLPVRDEARDNMLDSIVELRRQVAQIKNYLSGCSTGSSINESDRKLALWSNHSSGGLSEFCISNTTSVITTAGDLGSHTDRTEKSHSNQRIHGAFEDSTPFGHAIQDLSRKFKNMAAQTDAKFIQLTQRLIANENQFANLSADFGNLRDHLEDATRMSFRADLLQPIGNTGSSSIVKINTENMPCCRRQTRQVKKQLYEVREELKSMGRVVGCLSEQNDRSSMVQMELKEALNHMRISINVNALTDKFNDIDHQLANISDLSQRLDNKIAKLGGSQEDIVNRMYVTESRLEQTARKNQLDVLCDNFKEAIDSLQNSTDQKFMRIITEYNENFISIDNYICDLKDILLEVLEVNKHTTQKLKSVWNHQVEGSQQLSQMYKMSDDVYMLLEKNVQKICELSKKEMCFEHEVKELKEKLQSGDHMPLPQVKRRMTSSFSSSFSEMKSKIMGSIKQEHWPRDSLKRTNVGQFRGGCTLMDESIQDQSGFFD